MDMLKELNYLQGYWSVQAVVVGGAFVFNFLTGKYTEKTANQKDVDEELGWLEWRRR